MDVTLDQDLQIELPKGKALELQDATLNLNKHTLSLTGNLLHSGGVLNVNGGTLKISGDYNQSIEGYAYSTGILQMTNAADKVIIDGSFTIDNYENDQPNQARFTAGVLEVKGNFTQRSSANPSTAYASEWSDYNFIPSGTHKVILSGTGKQVVSFEDGALSHFAQLWLTNKTGVYFATPVSVTTLFEHNRLPFALADAANSSFVDYDNDKVKDNLDPYPRDKTNTVPDSDGDGVKDDKDAFPNNPKEWLDTDQDGIGNNADKDDDNDGVLDSKDLFPLDKSESLDTDKDGIGNNKDTDDDNDGMPDDWETLYGLNPLINDAKTDKDKDGLVNGDEYRYKADPTKVDSDHDGEQDKAEVNIKRNPAVNESAILQIIDSFL